MNKRVIQLISMGLAALAICANGADPLREGFQSPPNSARPELFWDWMHEMVTKEGITRDLEAMKRAGFSGALIMLVGDVDAGFNPTHNMPNPVKCMSPEFFEHWKFAAEEANRLGLTLISQCGPGWCHSGGPWIKPEQAVQHLDSSEVSVIGPVAKSKFLLPPGGNDFNRDTPLLESGLIGPVSLQVSRRVELAVHGGPSFLRRGTEGDTRWISGRTFHHPRTGVLVLERVTETLPPLKNGKAPRTFEELWGGYDPQAEPLDVEVLKEWEQDGVVLRVVRYRIGIFKGQKAMMAGVYGFPKGGTKLPGLVQIHGGGQFADCQAALTNAKRGYATLSIAWAGRISAPGYVVDADAVKLFWAGKTNDPKYKLTTDWGPLDAYHAPCRNEKNDFASINPEPWTLDTVKSPRNNPWFLCALGARRALTFLERQPEVDPDKLGVYGHSMGGKITVMVAGSDLRVKAAVPSCGGVSYCRDAVSDDPLSLLANGDALYLTRIVCPILFLSPANDFHGQIDHLQKALTEIKSSQWRVVCSPHHNHQDTAEYMAGGPLWFDQCLKAGCQMPRTPEAALNLKTSTGIPSLSVTPDSTRPVLGVDVFYTQEGLKDGKHDRDNTMNRFWHYAPVRAEGKGWAAELPLATLDQPLWVYANVRYPLEKPVTAAGYYYDIYSAKDFVLSSRMLIAAPEDLQAAGNKATLKPPRVIEAFGKEWRKEWFSYDLKGGWPCSTHKIYDPLYSAPPLAKLAFEVRCEQANRLTVKVDGFSAAVPLMGGMAWQYLELFPIDFHDAKGASILNWNGLKELSFGGDPWQGTAPVFGNLRWVEGTQAELNARREVRLTKVAPEGGKTYLDVAHADSFNCGYDLKLEGKPLQVGDKSYAHVIRAHAPSEAVFFLGGKYRRFQALAWRGPQATVSFEVHGDGKKLFDSGAVTKANPVEIDLPMEGVQELKLVVTDGGNGKGGDHAAWLDAALE